MIPMNRPLTKSLQRTMKIPMTLAALAFASLMFTGCVAETSLDDLQRINRTLEERIVDLQYQIDGLNNTIRQKDATIASLQGASDASAAMRARLAEEQDLRSALQARLDDLEGRYRALSEREQDIVVVEGPVPQAVSDALAELARANPDLMSYDESRGMIRLRSDLTFGLGSTEVSDDASAALVRLARVLNGADARSLDIQVLGHTDNVPVTSANGIQRYRNNWGLSTARAEAVMFVLKDAGTNVQRMVVAGCGDTRPIAANGERGNQANRRVEIFLTKGTDRGNGGGGGAAAPDNAGERTIAPRGGSIEDTPEVVDDSVFK